MSKKSILSTLLISSALLGTISASAATSAVKPEKKLVTITNKNAKIYKNSKLQESKKAKVGTVYKVNGFRTINKKHYYRVYQQDTKGENVYKGYILDKDAKDLKGQAPAKADRFVGVTAEKAPAWKNLYFNIKMKTYNGEKHSSNFEVKTTYTINGKKYASLYRGEQWMGYMDAKNLKILTPKAVAEDKQKYEVEKDYKTYNDIYFTEKRKLEKGTEVTVKRIYTFATSREYGSIYNKDGKWMGYANMKALKAVEASNPSEPDKPTNPDKPEKPDTKPDQPGTGGDTSKPETPEQKLDKEIEKVKETAKKVYLTKAQEDKLNDVLAKLEKVTSKDEANFKKAQEVVAKAEKDLASQPNEKDGKALDTALKEYADFDKAKDHLTGFDAVKSAKENADKVMAELKKDAANENKATVELTGKQVQEATKALEDAFSKVKIKTDNLKKAIEDAKKAIEGKHISADDKAKVDAAIKKAEEAVKNDTLSEKNLKDILDSEKAMQEIIDKAKDIAEEKDLAALKDAVAKVSEIDKHQDVKDMISTKYNDFTAIKKDFADAKAIVEGKKTTTKAEADKLAKDLISEAKGLKLKKGTMENNIKYAEDVLKKKDQYLPEGVANVEKAIKDAKEALAKNTLENYTDFKQKSEAVLKAPSELKKNATTNKDSLQKILDDVKKLDTIKDDIASKGDKVKEAYDKAEELNTKLQNTDEAKKTSASVVDAAKRGLETSVDGLKLNHKRLNDAIKTLTEDEKGHYLSDAQKSEAKEKLQSLVDAAKKATTVKEYDAYKKAVDALVKADKEMKKMPSSTAVNTIAEEYKKIKEKCSSWEEGKHKEVFSPETEKPFEDALKAIEKVGKAVEANGEVTKEDLAEAEKAPQAAHNLKFNADLIDKKVNKPAEKLVAAAKNLSDYANTTQNQTNLTDRIQKAEKALGLQSAAETSEEGTKVDNVVAIRDGHWHVNGWEAIKSAEDEVVKSGKNLQKALKKPLEDKVKVAQGKLATTTEAQKQKLQEAINKAEDDLNNNRYEDFKTDRDNLVEEIKKSETNGSAEAKTLQETIAATDKLVTVPRDDFAADQSSEISALQEAYNKAKELVKDPSTHTEKEMKDANAKLEKAAKALKLKVEDIKAKGKEFQRLVGSKGKGGEYYISTTQTDVMKEKQSSLDTDYKAGVGATTVDKYEAYKKADKELTDGIEKVKKDCPTKEDVQKARNLYKELKSSEFGASKYNQYEKYLNAGNCTTIKSDIAAINKVEKAAKSREDIKKAEIVQAIQLPHDISLLEMNSSGLRDMNSKAKAFANLHDTGSTKTEAEALKSSIEAAEALLDKPEDLLVFKKSDASSTAKEPGSYTYTWNKENITKVGAAEKAVYEKAKALNTKLKESEEEEEKKDAITTDQEVLSNPILLCNAILASDTAKDNESVQRLAKLVGKVAYPAWSYSTGYEVTKKEKDVLVVTDKKSENNRGLEVNASWTNFDKAGSGHYYQAIDALQKYAANPKAETEDGENKFDQLTESLVKDFKGMKVITLDLETLVAKAKMREDNNKNVVALVEKANGYIADPSLANWENIVKTTKELREALEADKK